MYCTYRLATGTNNLTITTGDVQHGRPVTSLQYRVPRSTSLCDRISAYLHAYGAIVPPVDPAEPAERSNICMASPTTRSQPQILNHIASSCINVFLRGHTPSRRSQWKLSCCRYVSNYAVAAATRTATASCFAFRGLSRQRTSLRGRLIVPTRICSQIGLSSKPLSSKRTMSQSSMSALIEFSTVVSPSIRAGQTPLPTPNFIT